MKSLLIAAAVSGALGISTLVEAQAVDTSPGRTRLKTAAPVAEPAQASAGVLQLSRELDALKREVQSLRGQLEDQGYALEQLQKQQNDRYADLDRRLQASQSANGAAPALPTLSPPAVEGVAGTPAPESSLQVETAGSPPTDAGTQPSDAGTTPPVDGSSSAAVAPPAADTAAPPPAATGDDATSEAAYRDAFALLRAGDYDKAIASFTAFQAQYPQSQYGDNAQYWLAEAYYAKAQYAQAITEYQKMQSQYPASKKLSHALLKTGYSYDKLGKTADATATLKALVQQYPGSAAARLGEERLAQIKSGKPR
jgi:tetratricopeptide (TPR) repeat protein